MEAGWNPSPVSLQASAEVFFLLFFAAKVLWAIETLLERKEEDGCTSWLFSEV